MSIAEILLIILYTIGAVKAYIESDMFARSIYKTIFNQKRIYLTCVIIAFLWPLFNIITIVGSFRRKMKS